MPVRQKTRKDGIPTDRGTTKGIFNQHAYDCNCKHEGTLRYAKAINQLVKPKRGTTKTLAR